MSYISTNWKVGDILNANSLNKIEQGIEDIKEKFLNPPNIVLIVKLILNTNGEGYILDKTFREIMNAYQIKYVVVENTLDDNEQQFSLITGIDVDNLSIKTLDVSYTANDMDDYPHL